jgi:hypothetical protein
MDRRCRGLFNHGVQARQRHRSRFPSGADACQRKARCDRSSKRRVLSWSSHERARSPVRPARDGRRVRLESTAEPLRNVARRSDGAPREGGWRKVTVAHNRHGILGRRHAYECISGRRTGGLGRHFLLRSGWCRRSGRGVDCRSDRCRPRVWDSRSSTPTGLPSNQRSLGQEVGWHSGGCLMGARPGTGLHHTAYFLWRVAFSGFSDRCGRAGIRRRALRSALVRPGTHRLDRPNPNEQRDGNAPTDGHFGRAAPTVSASSNGWWSLGDNDSRSLLHDGKHDIIQQPKEGLRCQSRDLLNPRVGS